MRAAAIAALAGALLLFACAKSTTVQTHQARPSGFLGDYSALEPGREDQAALIYIDPAADFAEFHSVFIEPVTIWRGTGTEKVSEAELQGLANYLHASLRQNLSQSFKIAEQPGSGTLKIRTAITEARGANDPATVTQAFVGRAAIEVEILDGLSGRRLVAAVDERVGTRSLRGAGGTWGDVKEAFDAWARVIAMRLAFFRALDAEQAEGVEADTIGADSQR